MAKEVGLDVGIPEGNTVGAADGSGVGDATEPTEVTVIADDDSPRIEATVEMRTVDADESALYEAEVTEP